MDPNKIDINIVNINGLKAAKIVLPEKYRFISSTIIGGGLIVTDKAVILQVPKSYNSLNPEEDLLRVYNILGVDEDAIGFMTAVNIEKALVTAYEKVADIEVTAIVTAGIENITMAGRETKTMLGTINIFAILNSPLKPSGLVNAVMTATEAKAAALLGLGIEATGTTTDAIAIGTPIDDGSKYAGTATHAGIALSKAVIKGVRESLMRTNGIFKPKNAIEILREWGITPKDLWDTALSLYIPAPWWKLGEIKRIFMEKLEKIADDVNISALVLAASMLEKAGRTNMIYGLNRENFLSDPVYLLADEMIGLIIAEYIAGIKGIFEYERYDREKPKIISKLGPFLDDVVASIIGGIMSRIYSELLGEI